MTLSSPLALLLPTAVLLLLYPRGTVATATAAPLPPTQHILPLHHPAVFAPHEHDRNTPISITPEGHERYAHRSAAMGTHGGYSELDYDVIISANTVRLSALSISAGASCSASEVLLRINVAGSTDAARTSQEIAQLRAARFVVEDPDICAGMPEGSPLYRRVLRVDDLDDVPDAIEISRRRARNIATGGDDGECLC